MIVLVLASFPSELNALALYREAQPLFSEKQYRLYQNRLSGHTVRFGITGEGRGNVNRFFEIYFSKAGPHELPGLILSTGYAGALNASLRAGDIIAAREIKDLKSGKLFRCDVPSFIAGRFPLLSCMCVDRFLHGDGKASIAEQLPQADFIDMESAAVAEICTVRRIPCLVIRAVSDPASFRFPSKEFVQDSWKRIPMPKWILSLFRKPSDFFRTIVFQVNLGKARKGIASAVRTTLEGLPGEG